MTITIRKAWVRTGVAIAVFELCALVAGVLYSCHRVQSLEDRNAAAQDALRRVAVERSRQVAETVAVQLAAKERIVTRTVHAVRVETLMVAPRTAAETLLALRELPALAIAHDSLQRACVGYVTTCAEYRRASLVEREATSARIAGLERIASAKRRRSWFGAPDLVAGAGGCADATGLRPCVFIGVGARVGW